MCGIAGFVGSGKESDLQNMIKKVAYRGPDDQGFLLRDSVGFAHARLSIIDLSPAGHQPMINSDKTTAIVFNGEIYNFKELKNIVSDYPFEGKSDTEVILALYDKYGEEMIQKLDGMFALALYDFKNKKLILARDRMGKKPLYYGIFNGTLIFASEIKALMTHPAFKKELDLKSLSRYLLHEHVPTPYSIFKNVSKLEAGYYAVFQSGFVRMEKYWHPDTTAFEGTLDEAKEHLSDLLGKAVKRRLVASDVPVGVFLSGGLDSSTVAYYGQRDNDVKLNTFSIGFRESSFDESDYAREVAKHLGTNHTCQIMSGNDALGLIPTIAALSDEPLADSSILPTYLLSKYTRQKVAVALGGDGGDELFAGYPTFQAEKVAILYNTLPKVVRDYIIKSIVSLIPASEKNFSIGFRLKQFINEFNPDKYERHLLWRGSFSPLSQRSLLSPEVLKSLGNTDIYDIKKILDGESSDPDQRLLRLYQKTYMKDQVLVKLDRASMYNSLEVRAPFLDTAVVEFSNSLPYNFKCRGLTTKYILKELMRSKLPKNIIRRPKKGFGIPLSRWLKNELNELCRALLSVERLKQEGLFNSDFVASLMEDHFSGRKDNHKQLWTLMVFQMWQDNFNK